MRNRFPQPVASVVALLILVAAGVTTGAGESARPTTAEIQRQFDDLFLAARYDSILTLIPDYIRRAEADHDSLLLGRMRAQRGRALLVSGRAGEAKDDIAFGVRVAEAMRDTTGLMSAIHFQGFVYASEGRFDDAMRCVERRLSLAQKVRSPVDEAWARSSIAFSIDMRGEHTRAREEYKRAIMLFRQGGRPDLEATPTIGLGRAEGALGNEAEARRCYQRAWVVARGSGDRVNEMWAANNLGVLESTSGDPGRADAYYQRAFDLAREIENPRAMVVLATNLAVRARDLGDFARAESILRDARELCLTHPGGTLLNSVDYRLAELRLYEGRYQAAGAILRRLLASSGQVEPQLEYFVIIGMARVLAHNDSVPQAIDLLRDNFEANEASVYATSKPEANLLLSHLSEKRDRDAALRYAQRAIESARELGWQRVAVSARLRESVCYRALGRNSEAHASLMTGLDSLDATRGGISTPEWREIFGQETARDILNAGLVLLEYPGDLAMPARERTFFDTMLRFKTRSLLERISDPRGGVDSAHVSRGVTTVDDLQRNVLRPGELLLEFFVGSAESYLAAVTRAELRLVKLPGPDSPLAESIDLYRRALASPDPAMHADFPPERLISIQRSIGAAVLGGVSDLMEHASRVLIAPDGFFASLPFGTLMLDESSSMLMETKDVVQIPSAAVLALQRSHPDEPRAGAARLVALEAAEELKLPGAHDEVRDLSRRYTGVQRVHGLTGGAEGLASIAAQCDVLHVAAHAVVVDHSPWQSGLRLVADTVAPDSASTTPAASTRSSIDAIEILSPADSALVAREFQADPFVRAWQIAKLSLPTKLTVLAACETAGGRRTTGEGVLGLTAAFMSAGVPVVVSSLWPVDDRATARVMKHFYEYLAKGETVATSLRLAQLDTRRSRGRSHPFYWAGFTVVGDGSMVVPVERASHPHPVLLALLALVVAGVTIVLRRKRPLRSRLENLRADKNRV